MLMISIKTFVSNEFIIAHFWIGFRFLEAICLWFRAREGRPPSKWSSWRQRESSSRLATQICWRQQWLTERDTWSTNSEKVKIKKSAYLGMNECKDQVNHVNNADCKGLGLGWKDFTRHQDWNHSDAKTVDNIWDNDQDQRHPSNPWRLTL